MDGTLSATPTSRHHPRKRVIQYSRDSSYRTEKPRRTGYPAFAGYDGCWFRASAIKRACYPTGKSMRPAPGGLSSPFNKNILIFRNCKSVYILAHPALTRGALRGRHGRWVRDAVDADTRLCRMARKRTAKSCGPDTPTLVSSLAEVSARRRWQKSPVTGESTK
jgi:hypothetical protein